jgi:ADP-ribose pyrophosphatase
MYEHTKLTKVRTPIHFRNFVPFVFSHIHMFKTLKKKVLYESKWVRFCEDEIEFPSGEKGAYAYHERVDAGAIIIPVTSEGKFLVLREWRYPIQGWTWCFPAGGIEKGESPLEAVKRELEEETGFVASDWKELGTMAIDPGGSSQIAPAFLARNLTHTEAHPDPEEIHEVHFFTEKEIDEKIRSGEFNNNWLLGAWCKYKMSVK